MGVAGSPRNVADPASFLAEFRKKKMYKFGNVEGCGTVVFHKTSSSHERPMLLYARGTSVCAVFELRSTQCELNGTLSDAEKSS